MNEAVTNFGILMDVLGIQARQLAVAVGADKTLISRWRSGERKLIAGKRWVKKVALYFIEVDAASSDSMLNNLIKRLYPVEFRGNENLCQLLERWLSTCGQDLPEYQEKRRMFLLGFFSGDGQQDSSAISRTVVGEQAVKQALLEYFEQIKAMPGDGEITFACPNGLEIIMDDEQYALKLMGLLMELFKNNKRLTAVLRTDYRISEVSAFSGAWLAAHLNGYITSWYYDEFRSVHQDNMLIVYDDKTASKIITSGKKEVQFIISYDADEIKKIRETCNGYLENAVQRFQYEFFSKPEGFLTQCGRLTESPCYLFQKMPGFGIYDAERMSDFGTTESEIEIIKQQFAPLFITPDAFKDNVRVCHIFCSDSIDGALDQTRSRFYELSEILGRRVHYTPQTFVDRLKHVRDMLNSCKNYHVCFLSLSQFEQIRMEIGVWGSEAAIAWIQGVSCTACRDYTSSGPLHGYCATVWERIPATMRSRSAALRKLNVWLKRAQRFGLDV